MLITGKAEEVATNIKQSGGEALAVAGDMLDDKYIKELVQKAAEFGGGKIHIIVNNAGYTWDGVVHKVCGPPDLNLHRLIQAYRHRSATNNGTTFLPYTQLHPSNSSGQPHRTSA